ncbi:MAG TPA: glucose 1-dehydrogenase [Burkholderiales bacterium]|jgi:3-oxoacyl-[acyl-carrier protein] reductase
MRLSSKVTLVTGAGSGIGAGIARRFAQEGAKVMVADINPDGAEATVAAIVKAGGSAQFVQADVTQDASVQAMIAVTVKAYGGLDCVVNNAGWTHRNRPMLEVPEEEFDRVYAVNVKSIYLTARHAVPVFRAQGRARAGNFVNIASTAGIRPRPGLTWYNGSKGAVITTSKSMAAELGPDQIRVNCINPVFNADTALSAAFAGGDLSDASKARFLATIPMGRFSTAQDVANTALYLASDEASLVTGVCIEVDGGRCV